MLMTIRINIIPRILILLPCLLAIRTINASSPADSSKKFDYIIIKQIDENGLLSFMRNPTTDPTEITNGCDTVSDAFFYPNNDVREAVQALYSEIAKLNNAVKDKKQLDDMNEKLIEWQKNVKANLQHGGKYVADNIEYQITSSSHDTNRLTATDKSKDSITAENNVVVKIANSDKANSIIYDLKNSSPNNIERAHDQTHIDNTCHSIRTNILERLGWLVDTRFDSDSKHYTQFDSTDNHSSDLLLLARRMIGFGIMGGFDVSIDNCIRNAPIFENLLKSIGKVKQQMTKAALMIIRNLLCTATDLNKGKVYEAAYIAQATIDGKKYVLITFKTPDEQPDMLGAEVLVNNKYEHHPNTQIDALFEKCKDDAGTEYYKFVIIKPFR